ncbi:MAG: hypothetical protein R2762_30470 [Bryobacteraceae bacterium]
MCPTPKTAPSIADAIVGMSETEMDLMLLDLGLPDIGGPASTDPERLPARGERPDPGGSRSRRHAAAGPGDIM